MTTLWSQMTTNWIPRINVSFPCHKMCFKVSWVFEIIFYIHALCSNHSTWTYSSAWNFNNLSILHVNNSESIVVFYGFSKKILKARFKAVKIYCLTFYGLVYQIKMSKGLGLLHSLSGRIHFPTIYSFKRSLTFLGAGLLPFIIPNSYFHNFTNYYNISILFVTD